MIFIETERLRLRALVPRDASRLADYRSDPAVARYQSWDAMPVKEAAEFIRTLPREFLANVDEWSQLAIADKHTNELLGDIGVCRCSPGDVVEIGFTLSPPAQGRGLAAEACRAAMDVIFSIGGIDAIKAVIDSRNTPAIALVRGLGMQHEHSETAEFKGASCTELHFVVRRGGIVRA